MPGKKPNILFITTDQQRCDTLGCYGNSLIKTPRLDELAAGGACYNRAYCQSPICIPSRITMITGKTAQHHGATLHNTSMRADERTLGDVLGSQGYHTHFIGKAHFSSQQHTGSRESIEDWKNGLHQGDDGPYAGFHTMELILGHSNPLVAHYGDFIRRNHGGTIASFMAENLRSIDVTCGQGTYECDIPEELYSSTYVGDRTCAFISRMAAAGKPFYCFASFPDPHWPIYPPAPWFHMYDHISDEQMDPYITKYAGERERSCSPGSFRRSRGQGPYDGGGHYMDRPEDAYKIARAYWGSISLIDKNVGRMMDALSACGIADDTIVVFTADHGDYMGAHGMMAKGAYMWEEFIRVPFLLRYPAAVRPLRTNALLSLTDAVPTLLELLQADDASLAYDGLSQASVLLGDALHARDCVSVVHFSNTPDPAWPDQHALLLDDYKLVYHAGTGRGELYNLAEDPREQDNLYDRANMSSVRDALKARLLDELILQRDRQPLVNKQGADNHGVHVMRYETWKREFDELLK